MSSPASLLPSVTVVIATRDREELLVQAVEAVQRQDYGGAIETIIVYDQAEPRDAHSSLRSTRKVSVVSNTRAPGLAGARNTGILRSTADYVAFCDDDDVWLPGKLSAQIDAMSAVDGIGSVTAIEIDYEGERFVRSPGADVITADLLARSRMTGAHPSTYVAHRQRVLASVGLVDEDIPGGYGEDYDWLLRLAEAGVICVVPEPLVRVLWHRGSYFTNRWQPIVDGLSYLLEKHPEIGSTRSGRARVMGQIAFATAALGHRRRAAKLAVRTALVDPREPRVYVTLVVAARLVSAETVVHQANRRGRGI